MRCFVRGTVNAGVVGVSFALATAALAEDYAPQLTTRLGAFSERTLTTKDSSGSGQSQRKFDGTGGQLRIGVNISEKGPADPTGNYFQAELGAKIGKSPHTPTGYAGLDEFRVEYNHALDGVRFGGKVEKSGTIAASRGNMIIPEFYAGPAGKGWNFTAGVSPLEFVREFSITPEKRDDPSTQGDLDNTGLASALRLSGAYTIADLVEVSAFLRGTKFFRMMREGRYHHEGGTLVLDRPQFQNGGGYGVDGEVNVGVPFKVLGKNAKVSLGVQADRRVYTGEVRGLTSVIGEERVAHKSVGGSASAVMTW